MRTWITVAAVAVALASCSKHKDVRTDPGATTDLASLDEAAPIDTIDDAETGPDAPGDAEDDAAGQDAPAPDAVPADLPPELPIGRAAWAFVDNPNENGGQPTQVVLTHFTDPWGHLTGEFANVWNCLDVPGGRAVGTDLGGSTYTVNYCKFQQTVVPGPDGTYLQVRPPADLTEAGDPFAEVQMYHGVTTIHDYFKDVQGFTGGDRSLLAVVNLQVNIEGGAWMPIDNAAFVPQGYGGGLGFDLGVDEDVLAFGQGVSIDYSYETDVIHHEYTHSVVGGFRLMAAVADSQGYDPTPIGLNEGIADYFPASLAGDPVLGAWALGSQARDLSRLVKCPDDLVGEPHFDGQMLSSTLWDLRGRAGKTIVDDLAFQSLMKAGPSTGLGEMADFLLETVDESYPDLHATAAEVIAAHGIQGCIRERDWADIEAGSGGLPVYLQGRHSSGVSDFRKAVPAPVQFRVTVPEGATSLTVTVDARTPDALSGGTGETVALGLALLRGASPISYSYIPVKSNTSEATLDPVIATNTFTWTLSGSCLVPGTLHLQFMNRSYGPVVIGARKVSVSTDPLTTPPTWDTCTPATP